MTSNSGCSGFFKQFRFKPFQSFLQRVVLGVISIYQSVLEEWFQTGSQAPAAEAAAAPAPDAPPAAADAAADGAPPAAQASPEDEVTPVGPGGRRGRSWLGRELNIIEMRISENSK